MINKIDVKNFGLYRDYIWDNVIGRDSSFRRVNIIYGRNYSGKTTLARIFKCLEDTTLHKNYCDGDFSISYGENNSLITHSNLSDINTNYKIRVYNSDFVSENLGWLHNEDGSIEPFTILGAINVELDKEIKEVESKLGGIESKTGLLFELEEKQTSLKGLEKSLNTKKDSLEKKLRDKANNEIKLDRNLFLPTTSKKTYTINDIESEISEVIKDPSKYIHEDSVKVEKVKLLRAAALDPIEKLFEAKPNFKSYYDETAEILNKKIVLSQPIAELVGDSLLQEWVRQGIEQHRGIRSTCGFCGTPLDQELWVRLDAHFNKESEELRETLSAKIKSLEQKKEALANFMKLSEGMFYESLAPKYRNLYEQWNMYTNSYRENIEILIRELEERKKDIFNTRALGEILDTSEEILKTLVEFNMLIEENNEKTKSLSKDQQSARKDLRLSAVAQFIKDIDYNKQKLEIHKQEGEVEKLAQQLQDKTNEVKRHQSLIEELKAKSKDESRGAVLVNKYLTHYFGHDELELVAEGTSPNVKFKVTRESKDASNLSEGECSLISFCYFMAKMEDELNSASTGKLIIYIDDPISSLDSNHIFFMFSLIQSIIAKPKKYCQLFISTHNLNFLKYLKQLTIPKYKPQQNAKNEKADINYFLVERINRRTTQLKLAPNYLKEYITEFNYLFSVIYNCSNLAQASGTHDYQYNFGNNMRKFLESYLFYKYPNQKLSLDQRIDLFFDNDPVSVNLVNRVINEYSHLGEQFERGLDPIDIDAMKKISDAVIKRIELKDKGQYDALLASLNLN